MDHVFGGCFNNTTDVKPLSFTTTGKCGTPPQESHSITIVRGQKLLEFTPFDAHHQAL